jgi:hypothetical protein
MLTADDRDCAADAIRQMHYTRSVPSGKSFYYAYDDAIIVFSIPANRFAANAVLGRPGNVWELTRLWAHRYAHGLTRKSRDIIQSRRVAAPKPGKAVSQ